MNDYRIFVGAFLSGELHEGIQAVRQWYDAKTARITPPHVTLAGTYWRGGPATAENEAEAIARLEAVRGEIQPFDLVLGGITSFPQGVIYLEVTVTAGLLAARAGLLQALGQDKHPHFVPHLTLAMRLDAAGNEQMLRELRETEWHTSRWTVQMEELRLMQRGREDPVWRTIHRFSIANDKRGRATSTA
ncbi:MAG: 2'-5' RNA ligase family protein [Candidatus Promineifilaceae bacterium]